jgi:hypothetical protein
MALGVIFGLASLLAFGIRARVRQFGRTDYDCSGSASASADYRRRGDYQSGAPGSAAA